MKKGFTLIEMLVVITIIGLLLGVTAVSYSTLSKSARDARRRTDLANLRHALEQYRSNNNTYPDTSLSQLTTPVVYIQSVPTDPKDGSSYSYSPTCNGAGNCQNYSLSGNLENPVVRYTVTPYGDSTSTISCQPAGGTCTTSGDCCTGLSCSAGKCISGA